MTRISIDDRVSDLSAESAENLGDVLEAVMSSLPPNRIFQNVSLDGRMVPKHEESRALANTLREVKELQIRTADAEMWAANGLDHALICVERVKRSLLRAAELYREERDNEANRYFTACVEGLERFLETLLVTRVALKLDFNRLQVEGIPLARLEREFSSILTSLVDCQERADYLEIADKVEYELLTNLCSWNAALKALRVSAHSHA